MNDGVLQILKEVLSGFSGLKIAILYGSFAKGAEKITSDIDLGVAGSKKLEIDELVDIQTKLSNAASREIDLVDLNIATGTVFKEALTKGKTILKRDDALYARILRRLLFEEADFEPLRNRMVEARRNRVLG